MNPISRRIFLGSAAIGLTAAVAPSSRASAQDRVSVACVGVRGRGFGLMQTLLKRSDVAVVAVCDVDENALGKAGQAVSDAKGQRPTLVGDFRNLLDNPKIDALVIATPHHWHAPIAVRALRAGKDVYVEKPASHTFREGRLLVEAAQKNKRLLQHGTQMRSSEVTARAGEMLKAGVIGKVKTAKAWNIQRHSHKPAVADSKAPAGVDYDFWLGPAPKRPFNANRFHGNWQWFRDYGNGDIGNDGSHDIDMACFGLGVTGLPTRITAHGSKIDLTGEREFPDNMLVAYQYPDDKVLIYEDMGWSPSGPYGFDSGNAFFGTEGYMVFTRRGYFQVYRGGKPMKDMTLRGGAGNEEHMANFIDCVRTRKQPNASAEIAHNTCGLVHLGEIAYRVERVLHFDPKTEQIVNDKEANAMLTKEYRKPWEMETAG